MIGVHKPRVILTVWLLALLMGVMPAMSEAFRTGASVSQSSGTGGTVSRMGEAEAPLMVVTDENFRYPDYVRVPNDPDFERLVNGWFVDRADEGSYHEITRYGNLLEIQKMGSGYGCQHAVVFDLTTRRQLSLSDIFLDGVNYIDYINRYVAYHLDEALDSYGSEYGETVYSVQMVTEHGEAVDLTSRMDIREAMVKAPFAGFPSDYPLFSVKDGWLTLYINENNPYFRHTFPGYGMAYLTIPLTPDISPFGTRYVSVSFVGENVGRHVAALPILHIIGDPNAELVMDRINAAFHEMYVDSIPITAQMDAELAAKGSAVYEYIKVLMYPSYHIGRDTIAMRFAEMSYEGSGPFFQADNYVLSGRIYSLETGEMIDLSALAAANQAVAGVLFYEESEGPGQKARPLDAYAVPEGVAYTGCWYASTWNPETWRHDLYLTIRMEEPSGHRVRMLIPIEEYL